MPIKTLKSYSWPKKCGPKEVFKLVKDSVESGLTRENCNECLRQLISNKSVNHSTINSRECLSLLKNEINLADSNNNDNTISHDNIISHNDTCALKENLNSYQVKCIKKLQNVKDSFLKKLSILNRTCKEILEKKYMMRNMKDF